MKGVKRILACVDLSDYSKLTMEFAIELSTSFQTELVILNVINTRDVYAVESYSDHFPEKFNLENFIKKTKAYRHKRINEMIQENFSLDTTQVSILVSFGNPFEKILETIKKEKIDLVVIGNKGKTNLLGTLLGLNAEKVFRHSPVPVLIVRDSAQLSGRK